MREEVRTWHYGLVARWWDEFNQGGEDVEYFRQAIERSGEPALDAGCGTGRLLLPFVRAGMDVDGTDASSDMLDLCRARAEAEGLEVTLRTQPMHLLDLPRRYRTIVVCGAFGVGGTRAEDLEGLRRIREHLEVGGELVLDHHLPPGGTGDPSSPTRSLTEPAAWPEEGDRRRAADGSELDMRSRLLGFDGESQTATREICVRQFVDGREVGRDTHALTINPYTQRALEELFVSAGFRSIQVTGGLEDRPVRTGEDDHIVFSATR